MKQLTIEEKNEQREQHKQQIKRKKEVSKQSTKFLA